MDKRKTKNQTKTSRLRQRHTSRKEERGKYTKKLIGAVRETENRDSERPKTLKAKERGSARKAGMEKAFPEIQTQIQRERDRVSGRQRLGQRHRL